MFIFLILAAFVITVGECDEVVLNSLVDLLLEGVEEELRQGGRDSVAKVPDVNKSWDKSVGPITFKAKVVCTGGKISSLGRIERNGDVILKKEGGHVSLRANLALKELTISYNNCIAKAAGITITNPLALIASHVALVIQVSMNRTFNNCTNELDYLVVTNLGALTSDMGPGVWASIKETLLEKFANRNNDRIINSLNHKLESAATKALLKKKDFCSKLFFYVRN